MDSKGFDSWRPQPKPTDLQTIGAKDIKSQFENSGIFTIPAGTTVLLRNQVCKTSKNIQCDITTSRYVKPGDKYSDSGELSLLPTSDEAHHEYLKNLAINKDIKSEESGKRSDGRGSGMRLRNGKYTQNPFREWLMDKSKNVGIEVNRLRKEAIRVILEQNPEISAALGNPDPSEENVPIFDIRVATDDEISLETVKLPSLVETDVETEKLKRLMDVYETFSIWRLYPQEYVIGSFRRGELEHNWDIKFAFNEFNEKEQRPIWSFACEDAYGKKLFVKAVTDPSHPWAPLESRREMFFYQEAQSEILREMEQAGLNIGMPILEKASGDGNIIVLSRIDGEDISAQHFEIKPDFDQEDAQNIHQFILKFHEKPLSWWRENAPEFLKTFGQSSEGGNPLEGEINGHKARFKERRALFESWVGEDYVRKMEEMLNSGAQFFQMDPEKPFEDQVTYVNNNMNAGSFMKGSDGKVYVMDWQVGKITHPAIASAYFIETLWQNPKLYDQVLRQTLDKFKNDKKSMEMLRYELVFLRLSGVAVRFYGGIASDQSKTTQEREHAENAMIDLAKRTTEAIDLEGVWKEYF